LFATHTTALSRHLFKNFSIFSVDINFQYFFNCRGKSARIIVFIINSNRMYHFTKKETRIVGGTVLV
jgi:hypothetical protein